jgi:hypothetical protein
MPVTILFGFEFGGGSDIPYYYPQLHLSRIIQWLSTLNENSTKAFNDRLA